VLPVEGNSDLILIHEPAADRLPGIATDFGENSAVRREWLEV
jgi:hypothetical protein